MKIDWSAHTPQEVWDALKDKPHILGPWVKSGFGRLERLDPWGNVMAREDPDECVVAALKMSTPRGRAYVDKRLREEGWILLDDPYPEPEVERLVSWKRLDSV